MAAGCAQLRPPTEPPAEPAKPGTLGVLDAAYDRTKWRWVPNPDGRLLLTHTEVQKCFIDPDPEHDLHDAGFSRKREDKTIGGTRYVIVSLFEKGEFWEVIYLRTGSRVPLLGVYSTGRCQEEAERILQAYERSQRRAPLMRGGLPPTCVVTRHPSLRHSSLRHLTAGSRAASRDRYHCERACSCPRSRPRAI
jgi:hypothetical protein